MREHGVGRSVQLLVAMSQAYTLLKAVTHFLSRVSDPSSAAALHARTISPSVMGWA